MIAVHIFIFILFLFGIFCTFSVTLPQKPKFKFYIPFWKMANRICRRRKPNRNSNIISKMQILYPLEDIRKIREIYYTEKIGLMLFIIFIGNTLAFFLTVHTYFQSDIYNHFFIPRNPAGGGERVLEVDIYSGDQTLKRDFTITVGERKWTEEETNFAFEEMVPKLEQAVLGENSSLKKIQHDLNFVERLEEYPVDISWKTDNYSVISGNGMIQEENTDADGTIVKITAVLEYYDRQMEHQFLICVYPKPYTEKELFQKKLEEMVLVNEKSSEEYPEMVLPKQYAGTPLSYKVHKSENGFCLFVLFIAASILIYLGKDNDLSKEVKERELQMKKDYPEIVSKMMLLVGAGMTLRAAFCKISADYEEKQHRKQFAYEEMLLTVREMKSGISEGDAYIRFGNRCKVREYLKFSALLSQNLKKGSTGLLLMLEAEEKEAFEDRKNLAKKLGEEAGTKLLLPMGLMLIVVLVIIIVPAFMSFSI